MRGRLVGSLSMCFLLTVGAGAIGGAGACASADGELRGGAWRDFDAATPEPLVVTITEPTFADAPPDTWKGIYRDFFGKRAKSSCAGTGLCHGAPNQAGARDSKFVCADVEGCYVSLTEAKPVSTVLTGPLVDKATAVPAPETAMLFKTLKLRTAEGMKLDNLNMPRVPSDFFFTHDSILRMQQWIRAGAKND